MLLYNKIYFQLFPGICLKSLLVMLLIKWSVLARKAPTYITSLLQPITACPRSLVLRSSTDDLFTPRSRLKFGKRAFRISAPKAWNCAPTTSDWKPAQTALNENEKHFYLNDTTVRVVEHFSFTFLYFPLIVCVLFFVSFLSSGWPVSDHKPIVFVL